MFRNKIFQKEELKGNDYENETFISCRFIGCNLRFTSFKSCSFKSCDFTGCMFDMTSFDTCRFPETKLSNLNFSEATIKNCDFTAVVSENCIFEHFKDTTKLIANPENHKRKLVDEWIKTHNESVGFGMKIEDTPTVRSGSFIAL